jgi:hypothetical protein
MEAHTRRTSGVERRTGRATGVGTEAPNHRSDH